MPTNAQLQAIHHGARFLGLIEGKDRTRYLMLLRNVAGVESATKLDNAGVEDVMAVMEDSGFDTHPGGRTYWRDKVRRRGSACGERMRRKLETMARESRYPLAAMCRRHSQGRTERVDQLTPREAWVLIEAYKAIEAREADQTRASGQGGPVASREDEPAQDAPNAATDGGTSTTWDDDVPF